MQRLFRAIPLAALLTGAGVGAVSAQDWRTISTLRRFAGEDLLRVNVEYGAGRLTITPGAENSLFRATLRYDANVFRPVSEYRDGELKLGVSGGKISGRNMRSGRLDLALGTAVPLDLNLQFGAAEADVELGGLRIREAEIKTGASRTNVRVSKANPESCSSARFEVGAASFEVEGLGNLNCGDISFSGGVGDVILDLTGAWRRDTDIEIDMGLGSLTLRVPRDLGIAVRKSSVLASFDSQGLIKRGDVYYSEGFDDASQKITINIDAALGSIRVLWVEGNSRGRRN